MFIILEKLKKHINRKSFDENEINEAISLL
jgi:hypothetical protein